MQKNIYIYNEDGGGVVVGAKYFNLEEQGRSSKGMHQLWHNQKKLGKIIIINKYKWGNIIFFKAREKNAIHTETRDSLHEF